MEIRLAIRTWCAHCIRSHAARMCEIYCVRGRGEAKQKVCFFFFHFIWLSGTKWIARCAKATPRGRKTVQSNRRFFFFRVCFVFFSFSSGCMFSLGSASLVGNATLTSYCAFSVRRCDGTVMHAVRCVILISLNVCGANWRERERKKKPNDTKMCGGWEAFWIYLPVRCWSLPLVTICTVKSWHAQERENFFNKLAFIHFVNSSPSTICWYRQWKTIHFFFRSVFSVSTAVTFTRQFFQHFIDAAIGCYRCVAVEIISFVRRRMFTIFFAICFRTESGHCSRSLFECAVSGR